MNKARRLAKMLRDSAYKPKKPQGPARQPPAPPAREIPPLGDDT
jgi:hypothetical protein